MTISSTDDPRAGPYAGNGAQTSFPFSFKCTASSELRVVRALLSTGAETDLVLDSDFSVALNADQNNSPGGTVTYPLSGSPMASTSSLTIISDLGYTQTTDIQNAGGFYPEVIENALDRSVMLTKQLSEKVGRSLQVPVSDSALAELPPVAIRALKLLGFDSDGDPKAFPEGTVPTGVGPHYDASQYNVLPANSKAVNTAALQALLNAVNDGVIVIPPAVYEMGTISVLSKANGSGTGGHGALRIEATGAVFTGDDTDDIIIDSSKRVQINGLDAPSHDLVWRGCWWSCFSNFRFMRLVIGDVAGATFSSNYWNSFDTCVFQAIVTSASGTDATNANFFNNCSLRGNTNQGFTTTRDYAIELNANQNSQLWVFRGGDISYHNTAIYNVGAGNTTGQIDLYFLGVYLDTHYPAPISRDRSRIVTSGCHSANNFPNAATLPAVARGGQDTFRWDRSAAWAQFSTINFIPNGDFRDKLPSYVGANLPLGSAGGATITEMAGAGPFGRYLNINQAATSGTTRFRARAVPFNGRYTGTLVLRNAAAGSRTIRLAFNDLFYVATISDAEWTLFTLTSGADIAAAAAPEILVLTNDATAFNVDVCYAAITFGEGGPPFALATPHSVLIGSATYDAPSIANGAETTTTVTVAGAVLGDSVTGVSFSLSLQGIKHSAYVSAADTVTVVLRNDTGGAIDLASGTLRVAVTRSSY